MSTQARSSLQGGGQLLVPPGKDYFFQGLLWEPGQLSIGGRYLWSFQILSFCHSEIESVQTKTLHFDFCMDEPGIRVKWIKLNPSQSWCSELKRVCEVQVHDGFPAFLYWRKERGQLVFPHSIISKLLCFTQKMAHLSCSSRYLKHLWFPFKQIFKKRKEKQNIQNKQNI